jgi:hypothetical protein
MGKTLRKLSGVFALPALGTAHMERLTDEQTCDLPLLGYFLQFGKVIPNSGSLEGFEALRCHSKLVTDCKPDPFLADIERQNALDRMRCSRISFASI